MDSIVHGVTKELDTTEWLSLSSKEQMSLNFTAAVTIHSDFGAWGRRSRTTPRFPRHREMRAFVSCMA